MGESRREVLNYIDLAGCARRTFLDRLWDNAIYQNPNGTRRFAPPLLPPLPCNEKNRVNKVTKCTDKSDIYCQR